MAAEVAKKGFSRGNTHVSNALRRHALLWKDPERGEGEVPSPDQGTRPGAGREPSAGVSHRPLLPLEGPCRTPGPPGSSLSPATPGPRQVLICELRAAPGTGRGWGHEALQAPEFQQALEDQSMRGAHPSALIKGLGRGSVQGVKGTEQVL